MYDMANGLTGAEFPVEDQLITQVDVNMRGRVFLGRQGEHLARTVSIDCTGWVDKLPGCTLVVAAQRSGESELYLPQISVSGGVITWAVRDQDTACPGYGLAEVRAMQGGKVLKSAMFSTQVDRSLDGTGTALPPSPPDWVQVIIDGMEAEKTAGANAAAAAASAADAQASASAAARDAAQVTALADTANLLDAEGATLIGAYIRSDGKLEETDNPRVFVIPVAPNATYAIDCGIYVRKRAVTFGTKPVIGSTGKNQVTNLGTSTLTITTAATTRYIAVGLAFQDGYSANLEDYLPTLVVRRQSANDQVARDDIAKLRAEIDAIKSAMGISAAAQSEDLTGEVANE